MIDLFRIRNGKFSSNETSVDLQDQLEEVMDMFQLQAQEKGLTLTCECDRGLPPILTIDVQRVKQIIINLIGNALKFTFQGRISIGVNLGSSKTDGRTMLQFIVRDTGIGVKQEDR
jgi:signal transduction histidine kinase